MLDEGKLTRFLSDELAIEVDEIRADSLLFSSGLVDSFALVSLMMFIEKSAGIRISPQDVNLHNFDSIERVLRFVGEQQT
jgi:acyl carrier protein